MELFPAMGISFRIYSQPTSWNSPKEIARASIPKCKYRNPALELMTTRQNFVALAIDLTSSCAKQFEQKNTLNSKNKLRVV